MTSIQITAPSLDDAKAQAAQQLGVSPDQIEFKVLEESKGLFGQSRVTIEAAAKADGEAPAPKPKGRAKAAKPVEEPAVEEATKEPVAEEKPKRGRAKKEAATPESPAENAPAAAAEATEEPEVIATQDDADAIADVIDEIIEASGLDADVEIVQLENRYVHIALKGKDASYLIGRRGEVLNSFQYLMNVVTARRIRNGVRVVMDAAEYRDRRRDVLTDLATQIAEQVVQRGEEAVLDALPAFERRIVHQALQEFEGVTTYSEGEEPNRRVVIAPAEA